jgi:DNA-binding CsgD family transcriptional regulator
MTESGLTPRQIAAALGISTQAVYFHLNALKRDEATA